MVFDLDGTLIDSVLDIAHAANHALANAGYPVRTIEAIRSFIGDGARSLVARAAGLDEDAPALDAMLGEFLRYYTAHATDHTVLLPCAREAVTGLASHYAVALCTNKPRQTTDAVLASLGLGSVFRAVVAGGDLPQKKPDPAPLRHIAEQLGWAPADLVMIGDGPQDIECARAAGARSIAVSNGIADRERVLAAGPDAVIRDLCSLEEVLKRWA